MQKLTPVQLTERETFMDVLRGFAILGIFIANLNGFSWYSDQSKVTGPYLLPAADGTMSFLHHMFIEDKFYSIFSLLFGWGIAIQIKKRTSWRHKSNAHYQKAIILYVITRCCSFAHMARRYCFPLCITGFYPVTLTEVFN